MSHGNDIGRFFVLLYHYLYYLKEEFDDDLFSLCSPKSIPRVCARITHTSSSSLLRPPPKWVRVSSLLGPSPNRSLAFPNCSPRCSPHSSLKKRHANPQTITALTISTACTCPATLTQRPVYTVVAFASATVDVVEKISKSDYTVAAAVACSLSRSGDVGEPP